MLPAEAALRLTAAASGIARAASLGDDWEMLCALVPLLALPGA